MPPCWRLPGGEAIFNNLTSFGVISVTAPISGNVGLTVTGTGTSTVNLNGNNTYTGTTSPLTAARLTCGATAGALSTSGPLNLTSRHLYVERRPFAAQRRQLQQ